MQTAITQSDAQISTQSSLHGSPFKIGEQFSSQEEDYKNLINANSGD